MAACMKIRRNLRIFGDLTTYCRINATFVMLKRGKVAIPRPNYRMDNEGNKVFVNQVGFPTVLDIDPAVADACDNPLRDLKFHPGIMSTKANPLPERLIRNARILLEEKNCLQNANYLKLITQLYNIFKCRQPPMEQDFAQKEMQNSYKMFYEELLQHGLDPESLDLKDREKIDKHAQKAFSGTHHNWKQFKFDAKNSLVYMGLRLAPNYRVLYQIFHEIHKRDENFIPTAIYNFGSGLGTVVWAADAIWGKKVFEYYNVDRSPDMNRLAHQLLSKDVLDENASPIIKGAHFRQNPLSDNQNREQFKMVVSAYSLMDQPSRHDRLALVDSLWNLTSDYLVLVDHGTRACNRMIMEARDFILWNHKEQCHVFAPCPHEKPCPKLLFASRHNFCSFNVDYKPLILARKDIESPRNVTEPYTYVVMKKGPRENATGYPRILDVDNKSQLSGCQMCCRDGTMRNYAITKSKPSKMLFLASKKSRKGDFLPLRWPTDDEMKKFEEDDGEEEEPSRSQMNKIRRRERQMRVTEEQEKENEFLDSMISLNTQQTRTVEEFDHYDTEYNDIKDTVQFDHYDAEYDDIKDSVKFDNDQYDRYSADNDSVNSEGSHDNDTVTSNVINSDMTNESAKSEQATESDHKSKT